MKLRSIDPRLPPKGSQHRSLTLLALIFFILLLFSIGAVALAQSDNGFTYTVQQGDTWISLSERTGLSVAELQAANPQAVRANGWLIVGEDLTIPSHTTTPNTTYVVQAGDSWSVIAKRFGLSIRLLKGANPDSIRPDDILHRGETLLIPGGSINTNSGVIVEYVTLTPTPTDATSAGSAVDEEESATVTEVTTSTTATEAATEPSTEVTTTTESAAATEVTATVETTTTTASPTAGAEITNTEAFTSASESTAATQAVTATTAMTTTEAEAATGAPTCQEELTNYADVAVAVLNAPDANVETLKTFLQECGVLAEDGLTTKDWTGDGQDDLVLVTSNPQTESSVQKVMDLMILNSGENGYTIGHHARAESEVRLLSTVDVNADDQPDVVWIETTCGANTCFDRVQVYSWDGSAWRNWSDREIIMAYGDIKLEDIHPEGQGFEIVIQGGAFGSVGAGPQRGRVETWGSVAGAPYTLLETAFDESNCLYHTVLDANSAYLKGADDNFARAEELYTDATVNQDLTTCWNREQEVDELRSFSFFRLATIAAYRGEPDVAADLINSMSASYPGSVYDQVGQNWLKAYTENNNDVGAACSAVTQFAQTNPAAWEILADYGYANPSFTAEEICPSLAVETPPVAEVTPAASETQNSTPITATQEQTATVVVSATAEASAETSTAATTTTTNTVAAANEGPACPEDLSGYAETLPTVLATAEGDELIVETWMRACDALSDARGAFQMAELNGDKIDDAIFLPTIVSDLGFGPNGAQGAVLVYHGTKEGGYELAANPEIYGQPTLLTADDVNGDGKTDLAWVVNGCSTFCVMEAQVVTWDGQTYTSTIQPGATIAEGEARFEPLPSGSKGKGQQLVLTGGVSGAAEGGLAVPHTEIWQSIDSKPFERISWSYDREVENNDCLGLRLVEADAALHASATIGYEPAIDLYTKSIDPQLQACSIFGLKPEDELKLLQGLASFRLIQAQGLSGDLVAAGETLKSLMQGQPDSGYSKAAEQWLTAYEKSKDASAACEEVKSIFEDDEDLWQITDHFGYNHPALAAEQVCYVP